MRRSALANLAALLLLSVWLWSRPGEDGARIVVKHLPLMAAASAERPLLEAAGPAAQARPTFELELSAWPPDARLLLDGAPLPANPYRGRVPADDGLHVLRAVAPGLPAQERAITFDRDRSLRLTLSYGGHARRNAQAESHSGSPVRARAAGAEYGASRQRTREIYEEDPYR